MRLGMVIDTSRCIGCHTCAVACKVANNLPNHIWWNKVVTEGATGDFPNNSPIYKTMNCQHCDNPPCMSVCPPGAISKNAGNGVVTLDSDMCLGCQACLHVCPYDALAFNDVEPEYYVGHALGEFDAPVHRHNTMGKCTFCSNRLERGDKPACMELCVTRARFWGDLDDPNSDVSRALQGRTYAKLSEERATGPNVYFLK